MMTSFIPAASRARPRGSAEALLHVPRVMIRELFLVLGDLPIELVGEVVDRGVHVAVRRLGMDRGTAARVHRRLRLVNELLDGQNRSEEHTSELQSREKIVCRLLLEKKKINTTA